jgi:inosine-uridine nucleoside N-ribohydrolase
MSCSGPLGAYGAETIDLGGDWQFQLDPGDVGVQENWFRNDLAESIRLPGSLQERGFGNEVSVDTAWTGGIVDQSWFTADEYAPYRQTGSVKVPFWLTPEKHYVGAAWYQRDISIPEEWQGKRMVLQLERCHWETRIWVDGEARGMENSLSAPHSYDLGMTLKPGQHRITVRVDNTVKIPVGENAHSVSDHTQSNWNGLVGSMELTATDAIWVDDLQVYPNPEAKKARVVLVVENSTGKTANATLSLGANIIFGKDHEAPDKSHKVSLKKGETTLGFEYDMGQEMRLWDEFAPNVYRMKAGLTGDNFSAEKSVEFGMRTVGVKDKQITINGNKRFVRGTLECAIFPKTGYPPTDVEEWLRIIGVAKDHGLNHLRFHSWCPPEAAFAAADRMGFIFQVECAAWATVGDGTSFDTWVYEEGDRILKAYGNHPSFALMAYGNEPGGNNQQRFLGDLITSWQRKDARRIYTGGAGWPIIPENQFHCIPAPRGQQWGEGLKGRFNARTPSTDVDYSDHVAQLDVPIVSHEIGQWCVYPNFEERKKYTGVLKAANFDIFRDTLEANHMLMQAHDFLMASGKLQTLLYKEEIEAALRTPGFGGFQLLDLHDFPGQGTALVGVLDPFWESKGYVTAAEYNRFCAETVPLTRMEKLTWTANETFKARVEVAHYGPVSYRQKKVTWTFADSEKRISLSGTIPPKDIPTGGVTEVGLIEMPLRNLRGPAQFKLTLTLEGTSFENDWDIWVYPAQVDTTPPAQVLVAESLDDAALARLEAGGKVLLLPPANRVKSNVPAGFSSIFWNTAWTRKQAPHTLGILCDPKHGALKEFPTQYHSNWQWWELISAGKSMILDELPPAVLPVVQVIDDWVTNRRLGLVFEAQVASGKLLVCSMDLVNDLENRPVARQMMHSLQQYMAGRGFKPRHEVSLDVIQGLFREPGLMDGVAVHADSEALSHEAQLAIDGDPNTLWHTSWEGDIPDFPHYIQLDFPEPVMMRGLRYLPRQDMTNGWIADYAVYVKSADVDWGNAVIEGTWPQGKVAQEMLLDKPRQVQHIRLEARSGFDGQRFASIAELEVLAASKLMPEESTTMTSTRKPIPVILDTDIGNDIDDTWALAFLLNSPELDLKLVVSDDGDTRQRAKILAKYLEVAERTDVPVGVGKFFGENQEMPQGPWVKDYELADYPGTVHEDGVGALIDTIMGSPEPITLICIGPVPNILEALKREPKIAKKARFVGMHGAVYKGYGDSPKVEAEYNVYKDVAACQAAFTADWDITITPLDTCGIVMLKGEHYQSVRRCETPMMKALMENYRIWLVKNTWYKDDVFDVKSSTLFDLVAVYLAFSDETLVMKDLGIRVTDKGFTVVDETAKHMNVAIDWKDMAAFEDLLVERLILDPNQKE